MTKLEIRAAGFEESQEPTYRLNCRGMPPQATPYRSRRNGPSFGSTSTLEVTGRIQSATCLGDERVKEVVPVVGHGEKEEHNARVREVPERVPMRTAQLRQESTWRRNGPRRAGQTRIPASETNEHADITISAFNIPPTTGFVRRPALHPRPHDREKHSSRCHGRIQTWARRQAAAGPRSPGRQSVAGGVGENRHPDRREGVRDARVEHQDLRYHASHCGQGLQQPQQRREHREDSDRVRRWRMPGQPDEDEPTRHIRTTPRESRSQQCTTNGWADRGPKAGESTRGREPT